MSFKKIFNEEENVTKYFKDIKNTKPLSCEEEVELTLKIKKGDKKAMEKLVKANLKFVITIAKEYQHQGLSFNDLINEGNIGLIKAAEKFDETRGFKFISYAVWWIRQSIMYSLNENSRLVRLPTNVINKLNKNKNFDIDNVDNLVGLEENLYDNIVIKQSFHYLNQTTEENQDFFEFFNYELEDENFYWGDENKSNVNKELLSIISKLDSREQEIIKDYFGLNEQGESLTLEIIGGKLNLSKERVRQIKENAIRKLRFNSDVLKKILTN